MPLEQGERCGTSLDLGTLFQLLPRSLSAGDTSVALSKSVVVVVVSLCKDI